MTKHSGPNLESRRAFSHDAECFFQRETSLRDCSFVEQPTDECYAVRYAPGWRKLR